MNKKEISQIRRRLNLEKCAATRIRGCYVSTERQVVSMFDQLPSRMPEEELEKYLAIFKNSSSERLVYLLVTSFAINNARFSGLNTDFAYTS